MKGPYKLNKKILAKLNLTRFGEIFGTLTFDEKPFLNTLLCFIPYWDYKPTNAIHADSPGFYASEKVFINLSTINKMDLKCDAIGSSKVSGLGQPISCSFVLDKLTGYQA